MVEPWSVFFAALLGVLAGLVGAEALARAGASRARLVAAALVALSLGLSAAWLVYRLYGRERWEPVAAMVADVTLLSGASFPWRGRLTLAALVALVTAFFGYLSVAPAFRTFAALGVGVGSLAAWSIARHVRPRRAGGRPVEPPRFPGLPSPRERDELSHVTLPTEDDEPRP